MADFYFYRIDPDLHLYGPVQFFDPVYPGQKILVFGDGLTGEDVFDFVLSDSSSISHQTANVVRRQAAGSEDQARKNGRQRYIGRVVPDWVTFCFCRGGGGASIHRLMRSASAKRVSFP